MLRRLTGYPEPPDRKLLTDDPLATISIGRTRKQKSVYGVTRVNPLFRDASVKVKDDFESSATNNQTSSERFNETDSAIYVGPAQRSPELLPVGFKQPSESASKYCEALVPGGNQHPKPTAAPRNITARILGKHTSWTGFDILALNKEYVSAIAFNLAVTRRQSDDSSDVKLITKVRLAKKLPVTAARLVRNAEFVKRIHVTTIAAKLAICPRLLVYKNSKFVVNIQSSCVHTRQVPSEHDHIETSSKITMDNNDNYVANISSFSTIQDSASNACSKSQKQQSPLLFQLDPLYSSDLLTASTDLGLAAEHEAPPDSLVTHSLLLLTSPDLSPGSTQPSTAGRPPSSNSSIYEDRNIPERVLQEFSNIIFNSRSVAAIRRVSGEVRSSAGSSAGSSVGSVMSRSSRASSGPSLETVATPVTFVTRLWERTGLITNGRKLLVSEADDEEVEVAAATERRPGSASPRRTHSPPVPPRLPVSAGWLRRVSDVEVQAVPPPLSQDPAALTSIVVEPSLRRSSSDSDSSRRVTFGKGVDDRGSSGGGGGRPRPMPSKSPPPPSSVDNQRLWNNYYGATGGGSHDALTPSPLTLTKAHKGAAANVSLRRTAVRLRRYG